MNLVDIKLIVRGIPGKLIDLTIVKINIDI